MKIIRTRIFFAATAACAWALATTLAHAADALQLFFALDRVKALAPQHPEWKDKEPFASLLKGDVKGALAGGEPALAQIVMATHKGQRRTFCNLFFKTHYGR